MDEDNVVPFATKKPSESTQSSEVVTETPQPTIPADDWLIEMVQPYLDLAEEAENIKRNNLEIAAKILSASFEGFRLNKYGYQEGTFFLREEDNE